MLVGCVGGGLCLRVLNLATGELREVGPTGPDGPREAAWSPDGRLIAYDVLNGVEGLFLADSIGETLRLLVPGDGRAAPGAPAWSPSGDMIAFHMRDPQGRPHELYVVNVDGTELRRLA